MEDDDANVKRAAKLTAAIRELTLQNENKDRQAAELLRANKELQKAEEKRNIANHLYAFISQVNQKIVRIKDEASLFRNACELAIKFGQFKMVWVGMFDDVHKKIGIIEHCGIPEEEIQLFTGMPYQIDSSQGHVLRTGTYYICDDMENDLEAENWRLFADRQGIRSCIVLPIKKSGIIIGTLNLYSTEPNFAGNEEIKLLIEVTGDISFALDLFEKEKQQKEAEEEIKASEMLYHSLFDNMLEGFAHCEMIYENGMAQDFIYLDVNDAFGKLTGLKNVTGKKATEQIPGIRTDNPELFETYSRVALTGKPERFEVYVEALKMWLDISAYSSEKGYFTAVFDVITEKKEAVERLANSEKHFRALIEHGTDMKSLTDKDGKVLYGSPSIKHGLGYTHDEFLLKYPYNLIHPDEIQGYLEQRNKLLQTPGKSFAFQQRRLHKNGTWIWCEGTLTNLLDEPGIHALVTNFQDISERKIAEEASQFNKNNLSALINNTKDLMWSVDRNFNLITSNRAFDDINMASFGRIIASGNSVFSVPYSPEVLKRFKQCYEKAFAGESFTDIEYFDAPVEMWLEVSYFPIRKGNEVIGTACHSRDITISKQAEKNLLQSEARLNEAQAIVHISNWEVDLLSNVYAWSDELYKIYGINKGDVKPSTEAMLSFVHPDDVGSAKKLIAEALSTLTDSSANFRIIRKDGAMRYGYIEWKFEFDKSKNPIRLYGILQDVTERKEAEKKLSQSENLLNEAQSIAHIGNWALDLTTGITIWSDETYRIFGIEPGVIKPSTETFLSLLHPDDFDYAKDKIEEARKTQADSNFYCRTKPVNGRIKYLYIERRFEFDKNKKALRMYGIMQDITERKESEEILKQNETRFREFFDSAPESIVVIDINTMTFSKFNNNALKLLKYPAEELIKMGPAQVSPPFQPDGRATEEKAMELITEAMKGGHPVFEWLLLDGNGKEIMSEVRLAALTDADGPQVIANFADITERKKSEKEILELNEHLEKRVDERTNELTEANKALEAFSYSVSHDLRSPVRSVMGFAKLIKKNHGIGMNENEKELFGHIEESGKRMNAIIDDLLSFAKWGKERLLVTEVDMTALFAHVWKNTMLESPHHAVLELQPLPKVQADMAMIRQVVINLISNAVKYSSKKERPVVKVGFEQTPDEVIFHVTDNGAGFDMAHYSRLFGAFQRLHGINDFEGTGIGLTLIKTIIEKHKGRVWAEGKINEGATFYFALPVV